MTRQSRFIVRVVAACMSLSIGATIAIARLVMGHEFYTCLCVAIVACWALMPGHEERHALEQAQAGDAE